MKVNSNKRTGFGYIDENTGSMAIDDSQIIAFVKRQQNTLVQRTEEEWKQIAYSNYSRVISYAEQLKAKHTNTHPLYQCNADGTAKRDANGNKIPSGEYVQYGDLYFLEYAMMHIGIQTLNKINANSTHQLGIGALDDPEWSQYSPEEIINMHNDGYFVPYNVLVWAQSHSETDLTSYIVLNDEGGVDPEGEAGEDSDVNNLKKKASDYIMKSTSEKKEIDKNSSKLQDSKKEVDYLQHKKKGIFKKREDSIDTIKSKAEELKRLDDKNKEGKLSRSEKARYKNLRKELGEHSSKMQDLKATERQLNNFLDSIDSLEQEAKDDINLSKETIEAGEELSKFVQTHNMSEIVPPNPYDLITQNKGIENVLAGAQLSEIPEIASKIGMELQNTSEDVILDISSDENKNLTEYAKDYTQKAENINSILHTEEGDLASQAEYQSPKSDRKTQTMLGLANIAGGAMQVLGSALGFMLPALSNPVVALAYTMATLQATDQLTDNRKQLKADSSTLNKDIKSHMQETKKLEQAINKGTEKQESNNDQIELFLSYLAELEEKQRSHAANMINKHSEAKSLTKEDNAVEPISNEQEEPVADSEAESIQNEASTKTSDIEQLEGENEKIAKEIQTPLIKTKKLATKNSSMAKDLKVNNAEFSKSTMQTQNLSVQSVIGGPFAIGFGFYNINLAASYISMGIPMLASPFTYPFGQFLCNVGITWIAIGSSQVGLGTNELAAGVVGLDETSRAKEQSQVNKSAISNETIASKIAAPVLNAADKKLSELGVSTVGSKSLTDNDDSSKSDDNVGEKKEGDTLLPVKEDTPMLKIEKDVEPVVSNNTNNLRQIDNNELLNKAPENTFKMGTSQQVQVPNQTPEKLDIPRAISSEKESLVSSVEKITKDSLDTDDESKIRSNVSDTAILESNVEALNNKESDYNAKTAVNDAKNSISSLVRKQIEELEKLDVEKTKEDETDEIQEDEIVQFGQHEETRSNDAIRSAAASTHMSLSDKIESEDVFDKKLTRFNNDSIIESRRKARRVTGVASTSKKRA